jgi:hypothetical protein
MFEVSPITIPVPWSIKNGEPISAPGCMSIPVLLCASSVQILGIIGIFLSIIREQIYKLL